MISLTFFPSLRSAQGQRVRTSWERLIAKLTRPRVAADKHDVPGISLATYRGDRRALASVERVYAVGLDFDHLTAVSINVERPPPGQVIDAPGWPTLIERFTETDAFIHTTYSSTESEPRARAFLLLSRPVTAEEYRRVYAAVGDVVERSGLVVDRKASDPSRFWFLPSTPQGGHFAFSIGRGKPVNVDWALSAVPPPPPPPPPAPPPSGPVGDVEARAAAYLDRCEPAISGQGGHATTFRIAQRIVRGFALDEETSFRLLQRWNQTCAPPWSDADLRRKVRQAAKHGQIPIGSLLERRRAS